MTAGRVAVLYVVWLLAAVAVALVVAILVGLLAEAVGLGGGRRWVEVVGSVVFLVLAAVPVLVGRRGLGPDGRDEEC